MALFMQVKTYNSVTLMTNVLENVYHYEICKILKGNFDKARKNEISHDLDKKKIKHIHGKLNWTISCH